MFKVEIKDLTTYLSAFIGKNLDKKVERSAKIMAEQYKNMGDTFSAAKCFENAMLVKPGCLPNYNVFDQLVRLKNKWASFSKVLCEKKMKSEFGS